jgi:hypothetical protein
VTAATQDRVLQLTPEEYLLAWSRLELGLVHWNLQVPGGPERSVQDRMDEQRRAWEGLQRRGLAAHGELTPELADGLRIIARPVAELNVRFALSGRVCTVVGSARGEHAVIAELSRDALRLRRTRGSALPAAVAEVIGERKPGSGTAVSVPARLLPNQRALPGVVVERALLSGGVRPDDARSFRAMLRGPKLGGGKFGAARYDVGGTRHPAEFVVSYFDTERGGYTIEQKRGFDGTPWYTLAPAHRSHLERRLADLLNSIRM